MTTEDRVMTLLANANPMPESWPLEFETDALTYLGRLEDGSSEMTSLDTKPATSKRDLKGRLLLTMAAVALLLGIAVVILAQADQAEPVATNPPVTTQVVRTTEALSSEAEEALAVATSFMNAFVAGDAEEAATHAIDGELNLGYSTSLQTMPKELAWRGAVGWMMEISGCTVDRPDPGNVWVACTVANDTAWGRALGHAPYESLYRMRVNQGERATGALDLDELMVTQVQAEGPGSVFGREVWKPFFDWVASVHPEAVDVMFLSDEVRPGPSDMTLPGQRAPSFGSDESLELWRAYTEEYVAEVRG